MFSILEKTTQTSWHSKYHCTVKKSLLILPKTVMASDVASFQAALDKKMIHRVNMPHNSLVILS
jgi:hypothetical protein